ncbi:MAG: flagellar motor protein MotB [Deltaproteobacteria bacterium]|nr:flagellar motor protein MotB [Deltaproteobacteria bacterium]
MARRSREKSGGGAKNAWMVTFSDLMTLLLTFFVLLLSMSSMDRSIIREIITVFEKDAGFLSVKGSGKIETRFEILQKILRDPSEVLIDKQRIKDLLFPDEILPPEINKNTLDENLEILLRPEGVALVLSDGILFSSGSASLSDTARFALGEILKLILVSPADVNVAGYTDSVPASNPDNPTLSAMRGMAVLDFYLGQRLDPKRFSVSAYGPNFPLASNDTPEGRGKNRRVEILLKTKAFTYL